MVQSLNARFQNFHSLFIAPLLTIIVRGLFHPLNDLFISALLSSSGGWFLLGSKRIEKSDGKHHFELISAALLSLAWFFLTRPFSDMLQSCNILLQGLPIAVICYLLSLYTSQFYFRYFSYGVVGYTLLIAGNNGISTAVSLSTLLCGIVYCSTSLLIKDKIQFITGSITIVLGIGLLVWQCLMGIENIAWIILAAIGISTLLIISLLEKYQENITRYFSIKYNSDSRPAL